MSDKIDDTLEAYQALLPLVGAQLREQVRTWTSTNLEVAKKSIELGGSNHDAAEKARRRAVRAYLLAHQALGLAQPGKTVDALRKELAALPKATLDSRLASDIAPYVMDTRPGESLNFGWSFRTKGTGPLRARCGYARRSIPDTLKAALGDVMAVGQARKATPEYAKFFGEYHREQTKRVNDNIQDMLFGVMSRTLWLYYRGQSLAPSDTLTDWPYNYGELGGLRAEDNGGATLTPAQRKAGGLRVHRNAEQSDEGIHIKLGKQVETKSDAEVHHTLVHELSHFICGTRDVKMPALAMESLLGVKLSIPQQMRLMDKFVLKAGGAQKFISKDEFHERTGKAGKLPGDYKPTGGPRLDRRDVHDSYGVEACAALAQAYPDKAVHNADSYAHYCMQFARLV
ncbi:MAG: hypothetical protein KGL43_17490 [Burkholderiales bacterium]|nr:hypothetical protein [Burkholderiales bacterium]MDE2455384.1 hypothetical protein [Burkholderiales bacterium]